MPVFTSTLECETPPRLGRPRPTATVSGYRVGEMLGRGGMSSVFEVTHPTARQSLVMKVVTNLGLQGDLAYEAIYAHAKAVSALKSPHIVRTFDAGRLPSREPFIVMERIDDEDLSARLGRDGKLPVAEAVRAVMQACDGLAEAHAAGIVHGDIKPSNLILVTDPFGPSCLKIVDFAPSVPSAIDPSDPLVTFSPGYAAPEQLGLRADIDARADIWALGVVLRELITGHRAFVGPSIPEMARAMKVLPPPMKSEGADVPAALERIVTRCLAHDRDKRFAGVGELRAALANVDRELLAGEARLRAATTARGRRSAAPLRSRRPSLHRRTLFLAALGPASALVTMTLTRVLLAFLY
jgi:serine/threonine protein kinase